MRNIKKMYTNRQKYHFRCSGFTLLEVMSVVMIIAILAAILLPVLARQKINAKAKLARLDCSSIAQAVTMYCSDNLGRFPIAGNPDRYIGGQKRYGEEITGGNITFMGEDNNFMNTGSNPPNADLMIILSAREGLGKNKINSSHVRNIKEINYLRAKMTDSAGNPGVGPEGIFRDPFGNPYVVTIDKNGDDKCWDQYYGNERVSGTGPDHEYTDQPPPADNPDIGAHGLMRSEEKKNLPVSGDEHYAYTQMGKAMVWSAGPDQTVAGEVAGEPAPVSLAEALKDWESGKSALKGCNNANADNILGW